MGCELEDDEELLRVDCETGNEHEELLRADSEIGNEREELLRVDSETGNESEELLRVDSEMEVAGEIDRSVLENEERWNGGLLDGRLGSAVAAFDVWGDLLESVRC